MDLGLRSPLLDFFTRGEVARDVRLLAAIPKESVAAFLGRSDVPEGLREFFRGRGIEPLPGSDAGDAPLVDPEGGAAPAETEEGEEDQQSITQKLALLGVADRMKAAIAEGQEMK